MKTPIEQYVIDKVREKRLAQKMSQATLAYCLREFADAINLSAGYVGDIEAGRKGAKYNLNHINELSIIFNCPFSDFFPSTPFPSSKEL